MKTKIEGSEQGLSIFLKNQDRRSNMEWRKIRGSLYYEVSDRGQVRNIRTGRILSPSFNGHGVPKVILAEDGENRSVSVARLVGDEFVEDYKEGYVIFYMDNDKGNVDAANLRWKPRWFAQEWAYQLRRDTPMRSWPIRVNRTGEVFENSLACAMATYGIEKYIVLACVRGNAIYNRSTYDWVKE
jgi:NUMOD4 motif